MNTPSVSLIILTRNEITGLTAIAPRIPFETVDDFFAVDYRSTDGTRTFLKRRNIPVITQQKPGRSEAFRIGARHARGDILIFFSPDGNENPADIPLLVRAIRKGADIAIASRFLPGSRNEEDDARIKPRKWANQAFTMLANLAFHRKKPFITDTINGYRAITKQAFEQLQLNAEGFAIEYQMTIRAMQKNMRIVEIPTIEGNRIGGASGSSAIPTGLSFLVLFFRELFSYFRSPHGRLPSNR